MVGRSTMRASALLLATLTFGCTAVLGNGDDPVPPTCEPAADFCARYEKTCGTITEVDACGIVRTIDCQVAFGGEGAVRACGACDTGSQSRTCTDNVWDEWGACEGETTCETPQCRVTDVDFGSPACNECSATQCCEAQTGFLAPPDQQAFQDCVAACATDDRPCIEACVATYPDAAQGHIALVDCLQATCSSACGL